MGSVACSHCGYVRWDSAARCPACGAEPEEILGSSTGLTKVASNGKRTPYVDVSWRVVGTRVKKDPAASERTKRLAAGLGAAVVVGGLLVYFIVSGSRSPEVLIQQGATIGVPEGAAWAAGKGGTLQGSFSVANGSAEVCFANYDMFGYAIAHGLNFNQCPSNATYSSGFARSGVLSGSFGSGDIYLQTFVPLGWNESHPQLTVTWTGAVEILPA